MIDFRYHLVSIVSIFLALAVGIVLGAGPLKGELGDTLSKEVAGLRKDKADLNSQLAEASAGTEARDSYIGETNPQVLAGTLQDRRVALVVLPGSDAAVAEASVATLALGRCHRGVDDVGLGRLGVRRRGHRRRPRHRRPAGGRRAGVDVSDTGAVSPRDVLLAALLAAPAPSAGDAVGRPRRPRRRSTTSRRGPPRRRHRDLPVGRPRRRRLGRGDQGGPRGPAAGRGRWVDLIVALDTRSAGTLVAGEATTVGDGVSVIASVRNDATATEGVSTVDNAGAPSDRRASCTASCSSPPARSGSTASPPGPRPPTPPSPRREPAAVHDGGGRGTSRAAAAAAASRGASPTRAPSAHRSVTSPRWQRTNHAGDPVTLLEGPAYVAGAVAAARWRPGPAGVVAVLGAGAFGALDDLAGDGASKGLKGHLGAAARGRGHDRARQGRRHRGDAGWRRRGPRRPRARRRRGALDTLVGGAVVAGAANLANLLDLRPGRALKATVLAAVPLLLPPGPAGAGRPPRPPVRRSGCCDPTSPAPRCSATPGRTPPARCSARALLERTGRRGRVAALAVLAGLTLASERVSFTRVIESTPGAARARRLGPAGAMTRRRFASGIAGAAGLIAVTTLLARAAGFARILVFADAVRAGGVGGVYQSVNALPNVLFEVAAGGILAAVAVPLIAHRLGAGERDRAEHTASVLLTWTLLVLVPVAALLWLLAAPISGWLVDDTDPGAARGRPRRCCGSSRSQVPLYGLGIILTGLLQAHRRFLAAALAPLASSLVVLASYLWYGSIVEGQTAPSLVSDEAIAVLGWGTTLGVVVLSVPLIVPAMRTGWRWRPALRMPADDARRIGALAGAGVMALLAQQAAVLVTMWLANHSGDSGTFPVYQYAQAVYLLPYAVLAVPVATSAFPALAARTGAGEDVTLTLARSCGPCSC